MEAKTENRIGKSDSPFTNPQSARTSVTLSIRLLNGSWLLVQRVLDSGATISCGSVYHHGLGHPLQTDNHSGTLLTDANGRCIPIAGYVCLDVQIEMEGVRDPVIIKGMRIFLIRSKQWKNLLLGCDILSKLNILPWQTLEAKVQDLRRPAETSISEIIDEIEPVGDLEANMVEPVPVDVPNREDLIIAEDLQLYLN